MLKTKTRKTKTIVVLTASALAGAALFLALTVNAHAQSVEMQNRNEALAVDDIDAVLLRQAVNPNTTEEWRNAALAEHEEYVALRALDIATGAHEAKPFIKEALARRYRILAAEEAYNQAINREAERIVAPYRRYGRPVFTPPAKKK